MSPEERRTHGHLLDEVPAMASWAAVRHHGESLVRAREIDGGVVVEIVTDDMPLLVDSVTNKLIRQGLDISLLLHPQFLVERDGTGQLVHVRESDRA